jgi:hypothetical protein
VRVRLRGDILETFGIVCVKEYVGMPDGQRKVIDEYQEQEWADPGYYLVEHLR